MTGQEKIIKEKLGVLECCKFIYLNNSAYITMDLSILTEMMPYLTDKYDN